MIVQTVSTECVSDRDGETHGVIRATKPAKSGLVMLTIHCRQLAILNMRTL
jgi:hypothetical protein